MLLSILIVLTVVCLVIAIIGGCKNEDDFMAMGLVGLLVTVFIGWIMLGNVMPQKVQTTPVTAKVLQDENAVHVSYSNTVVKTFNDIATFKYLSDKETVAMIRTIKLNMYGSVITETWELSNER